MTTEWENNLTNYLWEALWCKFTQNQHLGDYLRSSYPHYLGKASKDPVWGIGFELNNPQALNQQSWLESGNLLGRTLDEDRGALIQKLGIANAEWAPLVIYAHLPVSVHHLYLPLSWKSFGTRKRHMYQLY